MNNNLPNMQGMQGMQPIFILPPEATRTAGKEAQRNNIAAAKLVADAVRTTLGPKGMDKMLVDGFGEVTVTNDGVTILEQMHVEHPCAKMIVEIAKTQEKEVGDGTTTAVVLAGELLKNAETLLDRNIHPTIIARGYRLAATQAQHILHAIAKPILLADKPLLMNIAATAMTGKGVEEEREGLAHLVVQAATIVAQKNAQGHLVIDRDSIAVEQHTGQSILQTELIAGIVLDRERTSSAMPHAVQNAKIALLNTALEIKNAEIDTKISIGDPKSLQAFLDMEENTLRKMAEKIKSVGASVVCCQKGIDDLAAHFLAKQGVLAVRRVKKSDMERLAKATGGTIVSNLEDLEPKHLGSAGVVEEKTLGSNAMIFVHQCPQAQVVTIIVRGSTEHVIAEAKRAVEDAIGDIAAALSSGKIVAGAGAPEIATAKQMRGYANTLTGREQLAVQAFADALEVIPRTLAENAGLDPIDAMTELKSAHDAGQAWAGIDVTTGKTMDAWKAGVLEPLRVKTQAIASAAEVAMLILRIDDIIISGKDQTTNAGPSMME